MRKLRIGLAQMLVEPGNIDANLRRAAEMVLQAATDGCKLVVLPECCDIGWTDLSAAELARPIPGPTSDFFARLAHEHAIWLAAGLTERSEDRVHNAAILVDPQGRIRSHHRKINELGFARSLYAPGKKLEVVSTEIGAIGLNICADNYASSLEIAGAQTIMGAEIIVSPSSWAVRPDFDDTETPYVEWQQAYALIGERYHVPVVGVSNVGPVTSGCWSGWRCIGRSLATDASGRVVRMASFGESAAELLVAEIELATSTGAPTELPPTVRGVFPQ